MTRRAFNRLDVDRSHTITVDELKPLLTDLYHGEPPEKELKRVFAKVAAVAVAAAV